MRRFAAEFRGFWIARGHGAAIQRTADTDGHSVRKIFKNLLERGEKPKNWGARDAGRWLEGTLYRACETVFRPGG